MACSLQCINGGTCVLVKKDCSDPTAPFDTPVCDCGAPAADSCFYGERCESKIICASPFGAQAKSCNAFVPQGRGGVAASDVCHPAAAAPTLCTAAAATAITTSTPPPLKNGGSGGVDADAGADGSQQDADANADASQGGEQKQQDDAEADASEDGGSVAAAVSSVFIVAAIAVAIVAAVLSKRHIAGNKNERETGEQGLPFTAPKLNTLTPAKDGALASTADYRLDMQDQGLYSEPAEGAPVDDCLYDAIGEATVRAAEPVSDATYDIAENIFAAMNPNAVAMEAQYSLGNAGADPVYDMGANTMATVSEPTYDTGAAINVIAPSATYDTAAALGVTAGMAMYDVCDTNTDDQDLYATADGLYGLADAVDVTAPADATYCMAEQEQMPAFGAKEFSLTGQKMPAFEEQAVMLGTTADVDADSNTVSNDTVSMAGSEDSAFVTKSFRLTAESDSVRLVSVRRQNPLFGSGIRDSIAFAHDNDAEAC